MTDRHADDCPGLPVRAQSFDTCPITYAYKCSECGKKMPSPKNVLWPSWTDRAPIYGSRDEDGL